MPLAATNTESIIRDFDELARLSDEYGCDCGTHRYFPLLTSLIPSHARDILDIGCGPGQLTAMLGKEHRHITGLDISPEMLARARQNTGHTESFTFLCSDFLKHDFSPQQFDCVVTSVTLHHMRTGVAVPRMVELIRPGGRLIIHDVRRASGLYDLFRSYFALATQGLVRFLRTGWPLSPRAVRAAWNRHSVNERYLTFSEARRMAGELLPGAAVRYHWLCRYTIVWDKPDAA